MAPPFLLRRQPPTKDAEPVKKPLRNVGVVEEYFDENSVGVRFDGGLIGRGNHSAALHSNPAAFRRFSRSVRPARQDLTRWKTLASPVVYPNLSMSRLETFSTATLTVTELGSFPSDLP